MSLTSLDYDKCTYKHNLSQSIGPGEYQSQTPMPHCRECFSNDPRLRMAKSGNSKCADVPLIDVDSELQGITRRASNCPFDKWLPRKEAFCGLRDMPICRDEKMRTEDTRLSNPPCTLRGSDNGFNRWEWLCQNPQERVELPFDVQVDTRTIFKDNHRPCLPTPLDPRPSLPKHNGDDTPITGTVPCIPYHQQFNHPMNGVVVGAKQHWRSCGGSTLSA
jgi:hypothetical protein